ncbi:Uncharacterised protein [uncultured archaeon]|nr:Uncharacterised protein [uncultured archaeon]
MPSLKKIVLDKKEYFFAYKVVTQDMKSLGLRKNPNIIEFELGKWIYLPKNEIERSSDDWGGIWVARTFSNAKKLGEYMQEKYKIKTRIFETALDKILFENSYRIKTNGVNLFEEIL